MDINKFGVNASDLKVVTQSEFTANAKKLYISSSDDLQDCFKKCTEREIETAKNLGRKIFDTYLKEKFDIDIYEKILIKFNSLCKKILSETVEYHKELNDCAKLIFIEIVKEKYF